MKKRIRSSVIAFAMAVTLIIPDTATVYAAEKDTYVPITVNGYNADVVAEQITSKDHTSISFDADISSANMVLYSQSYADAYNKIHDTGFGGGLPDDRKLTSESQPPVDYMLASYSESNALRLTKDQNKGELTFQTPGAYSCVSVLGASASGHSTLIATLNYSDGTTSKAEFESKEWFYEDGAVITELGRVKREGKNVDVPEFDDDPSGPLLYQYQLKSDSTKMMKGISFEITNTVGNSGDPDGENTVTCLMAVSGTIAAGVPEAPVAETATAISSTGFTANWSAVDNATGYYLDVATDAGFSQLVSGYSNRSVGNVDSTAVTGLTVNTKYYYRVRAVNDKGQGANSGVQTAVTVNKDVFHMTYSGNGSTGGALPSDTNDYRNGQKAKVLGNTGNLIKKGYTFKGWNTKADGSGKDYAAGTEIEMSADVILYAKWSNLYEGTQADTPAAERVTGDTITVQLQTIQGETVEYVINTSNVIPTDRWQDGNTFSNLASDTEYYVFARVKANDMHTAGTASAGAKISTLKKVEISEEAQAVYYSAEGADFVVRGKDSTIGGFKVEYKVTEGWTAEHPTEIGSYDVRITRGQDSTYAAYSKEISGGLVIDEFVPELDAILCGNAGNDGWFKAGDIVLQAPEGFLIAASPEGEWTKTLNADSADGKNKTITYYLKETATGNQTTTGRTKTYSVDSAPPVIRGIDNGGEYYTTQSVEVTDNLETAEVIINGVSSELKNLLRAGTSVQVKTVLLNGNVEAKYTIIAKDAAGNETTVTVNMHPIAELVASVASITEDNVTLDNKNKLVKARENVVAVDTSNATEEEKQLLKAAQEGCDELLAIINEVQEAINQIHALPASDKITKTDNTEVKAAKKAYNKLNSHEKSMAGDAVLKKLIQVDTALANILLNQDAGNVTIIATEDGALNSDMNFLEAEVKKTDAQKKAAAAAAKNKDLVAVYQLILRNGDQEVQPDGTVRVTITLTKEQMKNYKNFELVTFDKDGKAVLIKSEYKDGKLSYFTDAISGNLKIGVVGTAVKGSTAGDKTVPKTGDTAPILPYAVLSASALLLLAVLTKRRRTENR